ncbi:MAG TPA: EscU/YscU/HrcU family type III secretion system export apparatus switch protein [Anaerolineaceae bacterium]|nr:EscU/YscU/HrcU family type III secretion system export apparatus switch protein [Anaerolineaceae bacterium]
MTLNRFRIKKYNSGENSSKIKATALGYDPEKDSAPRVVASGKGEVARKIIEKARELGIPIKEDPVLALALESIDINETIPPELYQVIAEVFAYIYRIQEKRFDYPKTNNLIQK